MPLPDDIAPGRALELAEELGRVVVASASGAQYAVHVDRRHLVRHTLVGLFLGAWIGSGVANVVPGLLGVVALVVVASGVAAVCVLRYPPWARRWVQVERFTAEESLGGTVAWRGVRDPADLARTVDEVVADARAGGLDALTPWTGPDRVRLRWGR